MDDATAATAAQVFVVLLVTLPLLPPLRGDVLYLIRKAWPGSLMQRACAALTGSSGVTPRPGRDRVSVLDATAVIATAMLAVAIVAGRLPGLDVAGAPAPLLAGLAVPVVLLIAFDLRYRVLPDGLTLPLAALGLLAAALSVFPAGPDVVGSAIGCFGTGFLLWVVQQVFRHWRGYDGLGGGDVKLAAAMGAWLGPTGCAFAIAVAAFGALAVELVFGLLRSGRIDAKRRVPFGAYLCGAFWLALSAGLAG